MSVTAAPTKLMCPHCGWIYSALASLVPNHCFPEATFTVCPGSGQSPRNAETDKRPPWKDAPPLWEEKHLEVQSSRIVLRCPHRLRVQRSRKRGSKLPEGAVVVTRPTIFGNPFTRASALEGGMIERSQPAGEQAKFLVECFLDWLTMPLVQDWWTGEESDRKRAAILAGLPQLHGKQLACYCSLDHACHADVLAWLANL